MPAGCPALNYRSRRELVLILASGCSKQLLPGTRHVRNSNSDMDVYRIDGLRRYFKGVSTLRLDLNLGSCCHSCRDMPNAGHCSPATRASSAKSQGNWRSVASVGQSRRMMAGDRRMRLSRSSNLSHVSSTISPL